MPTYIGAGVSLSDHTDTYDPPAIGNLIVDSGFTTTVQRYPRRPEGHDHEQYPHPRP